MVILQQKEYKNISSVSYFYLLRTILHRIRHNFKTQDFLLRRSFILERYLSDAKRILSRYVNANGNSDCVCKEEKDSKVLPSPSQLNTWVCFLYGMRTSKFSPDIPITLTTDMLLTIHKGSTDIYNELSKIISKCEDCNEYYVDTKIVEEELNKEVLSNYNMEDFNQHMDVNYINTISVVGYVYNKNKKDKNDHFGHQVAAVPFLEREPLENFLLKYIEWLKKYYLENDTRFDTLLSALRKAEEQLRKRKELLLIQDTGEDNSGFDIFLNSIAGVDEIENNQLKKFFNDIKDLNSPAQMVHSIISYTYDRWSGFEVLDIINCFKAILNRIEDKTKDSNSGRALDYMKDRIDYESNNPLKKETFKIFNDDLRDFNNSLIYEIVECSKKISSKNSKDYRNLECWFKEINNELKKLCSHDNDIFTLNLSTENKLLSQEKIAEFNQFLIRDEYILKIKRDYIDSCVLSDLNKIEKELFNCKFNEKFLTGLGSIKISFRSTYNGLLEDLRSIRN